MRTATRWIPLVLVVIALAVLGAAAEDRSYIGAAKCKMCHKVQFTSWETTPHATAIDVLSEEERGNAECLTCHATGATAEMPGVQCESCHGPGSEYKSMKVMKDSEASIAAGLVLPDEALCRSCHEGAPHDQKPFDYAAALPNGVHEHKE